MQFYWNSFYRQLIAFLFFNTWNQTKLSWIELLYYKLELKESKLVWRNTHSYEKNYYWTKHHQMTFLKFELCNDRQLSWAHRERFNATKGFFFYIINGSNVVLCHAPREITHHTFTHWQSLLYDNRGKLH